MADTDTTTPDPQTDNAQQGNAGPDQGTTPDADQLGDAGKRALDAERKAARDAAKRVKDLEAQLKTYEDANKSETDKLNERATAAEKQLADLTARHHDVLKTHAIHAAAVQADSTDPETVALYLSGVVDVDDDGQVIGVDKAITDLAARKPHLFRTTPAGARDAGAKGTPTALNSDALTNALRAAVGAN